MRKNHKFKEVIFRVIICNICIAIFLLSLLIIRVQQTYAQDVTEEWVARYNGPGDYYDGAGAIAIDSYGNVYVTGTSYGNGTGYDYATVSYDSSGNERWVARYNGPGNYQDMTGAISIDLSGNIYVTGTIYGSGTSADYATVSYDSSGNERWVAIYNGPANGYDVASAIATDPSGNVYVAGTIYGNVTGYEYATVSYDSSGNERWVARYNAPGEDNPAAIATDPSGNVYVTGINFFIDRITTVSYDSSGNERWVARYDEPAYSSYPDYNIAMTTDLFGNVYVTGVRYRFLYPSNNYDYVTISYDSSGTERWVAIYDAGTWDSPSAITTDLSGNVYVTGSSYNNEGGGDYATISYDQSGRERWVARYNGTANNYYDAYAVATDPSGNIYVTGSHYSDDTGNEYATVSYDSSGNERWVAKYNATGDGDNHPYAIAVDTSGNVYVTGESLGYVNDTYSYDYATIKYSQIPEAPCSSIITSPNEGDIFCAGQEVTFTAVATPVGYEHLIQWSGGGTPATGSGASFTTKFSTDGEKTITASCGESSVTRAVTILPKTSNCLTVDFSRNIEGPLNAVKSVLKKVPGVKEVDVSISAGVEQCDCCYLGTIIEKGEVSGNFGISLTGSGSKTLIGVPPLHIQLSRFGYRVIITGEFGGKLAGEISGNGSGTIKQECNTERCIEGPFEISGSVSAEVKGEAKICAKRPMEQGQCWGVDITPATLSTGVTGQFSLNTCDENLWELCWDGLVYKATIKVRIPFTNIEFDVEKSIPIWDKKCWP